MATQADLNRTGLKIERMWREGAPARVMALEAQGQLYDFLLGLQTQYLTVYTDMVAKSRPYDEVMETVTAMVAPPLEEQPQD
jgi:hypothetical protein